MAKSAQTVMTGDRWAPDQAPGKADCRRRCLNTVYERLGHVPGALSVLSLCGAVPYTENALIQHRPAEFDLVERDPKVRETLKACLTHEYPLVKQCATVYGGELEEFLKMSRGTYDVAFFDMMGGWSPAYARIFDRFVSKHSKPGTLIFFTFNSEWRFANAPAMQVYPVEELTERYPLKLVWQHSYSDSANNRITMTTMAFEVQKEVAMSQQERYSYLIKEGYGTIQEVMGNPDFHAVGGFTAGLKKHYPKMEGVQLHLPSGKVSLYSPEQLALIRTYHQNFYLPSKGAGIGLASIGPEWQEKFDAGWRPLHDILGTTDCNTLRNAASSLRVLPGIEYTSAKGRGGREVRLYAPESVQKLQAHFEKVGYIQVGSKPPEPVPPTVTKTLEVLEALKPELPLVTEESPLEFPVLSEPCSSVLDLLKQVDPKLHRAILAVAALIELGV